MQEQVCKNCGHSFTGKFCNNCGEKVYSENSKSFGHLAEEVFHFFTHLDSKYLKTLKTLFTRPGLISEDFCDGVRKKYFKPVSFFLIGVVIYLLMPISQGLNMPLQGNMITFKAWHLPWPEKLVAQKMSRQQVSFETLAEKYHHKSTVIAKPMLFIILPLLALALMLFFYKRRQYYFDHFIFAVELSNFFLYFAFIIVPMLFLIIAKLAWWIAAKDFYFDDYITGPVVIAALLIHWVVAFKRFYKLALPAAVLKAILFFIPFILIVFFIYRILLFLTTLLFI